MNYSRDELFKKLEISLQADRSSAGLLLNTLPLIQISCLPINNTHNTVFSFDSFCEPHLARTVQLIHACSSDSSYSTTLLLSPLSHYILSIPGFCSQIDLYSISQSQLKYLDIQLIHTTENLIHSLHSRPVDILASIFDEHIFPQSARLFTILHRLIISLVGDPQRVNFFKVFPVDQFVIRDISLTYKVSDIRSILSNEYLHRPFWLGVFIYTYLFTVVSLYFSPSKNNVVVSDYAPCFTVRYLYNILGCTLTQVEGPMPYFLDQRKENYAILCSGNYKSILAEIPNISSNLRSSSIKKELILQAFSHLHARINGGPSGHVYSPSLSNNTISLISKINNWKRSGNKGKIFTVYTSSSDESFADIISLRYQDINTDHLSSPIFPDHDSWIEYLCELFKYTITDSLLIIRIHPRQGADHRGLPESASYTSLKKLLSSFTGSDNIIVIEPNLDISSYFLGLHSDYILNGWSTIGFELSLLGKPVIGAFNANLCGSSYSFIDQPCFMSSTTIAQYRGLLISASRGLLSYSLSHGYNSLLYLLLISYSYVYPISEIILDDDLNNPKINHSLLPSIFDEYCTLSESQSYFCSLQEQLLATLNNTTSSIT